MGLHEEIFENFFKKLKDAKLPDAVIKELRMLLENGEIGTKEKILDAVKKGIGDADKNQKH